MTGLANASHAPPADEMGVLYAALSAELVACRLSAFRPESCQKPACTPSKALEPCKPLGAWASNRWCMHHVERGVCYARAAPSEVVEDNSTLSMQQVTR